MNIRRNSLFSSEKLMILHLIIFLVLAFTMSDIDQPDSISTSGSSDDAEVVKQAQKGNEKCFNILYQSYYPQIYKYLLRLVGTSEDADDLAVDTFLKVWHRFVSLHDITRFRPWLFRIATRKALDFLRARSHQTYVESLTDKDLADENSTRFEDWIEAREHIMQALMQVAPKPRACLLLQLEGFSLGEIARVVGLGEKSAGTYVSTAKEQLRLAYHRLQEDA